PGGAEADLRQVGHVSQQPQSALLHADEGRTRAPREAVEPLEAARRDDGARARAGTGAGLMANWRRRSDDDFSAEVQAHLDLEIARLVEDGMSPDAARAAARKAFGNVTRAQERFHESTRWVWIEQFVQDLRYAARGMRKSPSFVATAVLTLGVALGLLTVAFTVFNAYVLRPFAVHDPSRLYRLGWRSPEGVGRIFSWNDYQELQTRTDL